VIQLSGGHSIKFFFVLSDLTLECLIIQWHILYEKFGLSLSDEFYFFFKNAPAYFSKSGRDKSALQFYSTYTGTCLQLYDIKLFVYSNSTVVDKMKTLDV
jgi:hypothetical protein